MMSTRAAGVLAIGWALVTSGTVTACSSHVVACAGQCSAPYQLRVIFKPGTTLAAARSVLRQCSRDDRNVIRLGHVHKVDGQFWITVYMHREYTPKSSQDMTQNCLRAQPRVVSAAWPD